MPIPFILAGLGIAAAGVIGHCAQEVANDYADELDSINNSMEKLQDKTNEEIRNTKETFELRINNLDNQRKKVLNTTLTNFANIFSKIKNVEFDSDMELNEIQKFKQNLVEYNDNSSSRSEFWSKPSVSLATSVLFGTLGGGALLVGGFIKSMKLQYQIDEAKAERSKLRAECEAAKKDCTKINSLSKYLKTTYSTISTLAKLTDQSNRQVRNIISESGINYSKYSKTEKEQVRMACNFAMSLNDIVNTQIFNDEGKINPQFKKYVNGITELIGEEN